MRFAFHATLPAAGLLALALVVPSAASAATWGVDAAHTEVNFSISHFFTPVTGSFKDFEIDLDYDPDNPENSSVSARIAVASVDTGNEQRDGHLRTADWFETDAHPNMIFVSKSVRAKGDDLLVAAGTLTIKDHSREIELPIQILGTQEIPEEMREMLGGSEKVASFKAALTIPRGDYDVGTGSWAGTLVVGSDVSVELLVEAHLRP